MPWWVPLALPLGFLAWGMLFVAASDFLEWITRRRERN
jgi:hypothetical protein